MPQIRVIVLILSLVLAVQGGVWLLRNQPELPTGPSVGELLPSVMVKVMGQAEDEQLSGLLTESRTCTLLVFASSECVWCRRMRSTWPADVHEWTEETGLQSQVTMIWLMTEESEAARSFFSGYDFEKVTRAAIAAQPALAWHQLGVFGTPTTYLLDARGRLRSGTMGDRLPPGEIAKEWCD